MQKNMKHIIVVGSGAVVQMARKYTSPKPAIKSLMLRLA